MPSNVVSLPDDIKPEDFPELLEQTLVSFNDGDVIEGTIVRVDRNEVMVDVGYKSEGVIPSRELSVRKGVNPKEIVNEGDKIQALVLDKEDDEGRLILSVKRAVYEKAWGDIQEISDNKKSIKGTVIESVKGSRGAARRAEWDLIFTKLITENTALDELWQAENWGFDEETSQKRKEISIELNKCIFFLDCL